MLTSFLSHRNPEVRHLYGKRLPNIESLKRFSGNAMQPVASISTLGLHRSLCQPMAKQHTAQYVYKE